MVQGASSVPKVLLQVRALTEREMPRNLLAKFNAMGIKELAGLRRHIDHPLLVSLAYYLPTHLLAPILKGMDQDTLFSLFRDDEVTSTVKDKIYRAAPPATKSRIEREILQPWREAREEVRAEMDGLRRITDDPRLSNKDVYDLTKSGLETFRKTRGNH